MKPKFKSFTVIILFLIIICTTNTKVFAKTFETKEVAADKAWVIKFNKDVDINEIYWNIKVKDFQGDDIPIGLMVHQSCKSKVTVLPPTGGYKLGEYTLTVSDEFKLVKNKKLKESYAMKFIVNKAIEKNAVHSCYELMQAIENKVKDFKIVDEEVQQVYDKANEIINNVTTSNMTDYEKEKALHDYIVKNTEYDEENYDADTIPQESYSPYGILIKNTGVCSGYAKTMKLLLNMVDINCKVISGQGNYGSHAWNKVEIDGKEYNLDATWDDPVPDKGPNYVRYDYFNISDDELSKDHNWDVNVNSNGKNYKIKYRDYKFYKENNIKIGTTKKISVKVALPNGEKAPKGGAYILVSIEIPDGNDVCEKDCYIPEGKNSFDFSTDVSLNESGYKIRYWLDFEKEEPKYNYVSNGYYTTNQETPEIIKANNSDDYIANIEIPKANLIKGRISLANGEVAPKGGVKVYIEAVLCKFLTFHKNGETKYPTDCQQLTIPEGKNSIEYDLLVTPNKCGYYILYFIDDNGYKYKEDGVNITRFYVNEKDTEKHTKANIILFK